MDIMSAVRNQWDAMPELKDTDDSKKRVLKAVLENFHGTDKIIFDKCRGWVSWIELLEDILGRKVKILVPVRDMRMVLASFEKLNRKNYLAGNKLDQQMFLKTQSIQGRCETWLSYNSPLGIAYNRINDALLRGLADRLYFVHFEKLTSDPEAEMKRIYDFLGEEYFNHDFENVEQVVWEDDSVWGMGDLHSIRSKVEPVKENWGDILGGWADVYKQYNF
jgi:sulfotransferase